jgi:tartrate dehydrogenase/decarboxylase / D-malate dehydrogenase
MRESTIAAAPRMASAPKLSLRVLKCCRALAKKVGDFQLKVETFPWGSDYYKKHGVMMPQNGLEVLRPLSAIYFGAVGAPDVPDHITLWGLRLAFARASANTSIFAPRAFCEACHRLCTTANLATSIAPIVRENSEGEYAGHGGRAP